MLYSRTDCKSSTAEVGAPVCPSRDASSYAACSSRYQQHPADVLQQNAAPATGPQQPSDHGGSRRSCSRQQQLCPPPVRYSSHTSNLACLSKAGGGTLLPHAHQKWAGRGYPVEETTCTCVLPRTSVLCRLLVAMTVLLVFVQAVSCGMFFCVTLPVSHGRGSFAEYEELITDLSAPTLAAQHQPAGPVQAQQAALKAVPKLIPRFIHQTYRSGRLPAPAKSLIKTWAEVNGDSWQVRFYSDEAALTFVRREFPEYFDAYLSLPKDVERADFFRFMVVLRLGGAYADIDAECRQPLDNIIQPADTLLVGWDTEVATAETAAATGLARQRLIANWFFVAAAGHPVLREVCDHIARNALSVFSKNPVRDTAERTGQGMWTDLVLRHALQHKAAKHDDPWKVRILPRVAFGVRPVGDDAALRPDTPGVVVLHHFMSSWQSQRHRRLMQAFGPLLSWGRSPARVQEIAEPVLASNVSHFPVSITFHPPFTFMTDLIGLGDVQAAADVSATITAHGTWQPGMAPYRKPAVVDALVGALAKHSSRATNTPMGELSPSASEEAQPARSHSTAGGSAATAAAAAAEQAGRAAAASSRSASSSADSTGSARASSRSSPSAPGHMRGGVLVDVGAGQGFFSLAAAARGHRVLAFEASPASLAAFKASIAYNGFQGLITVVNAAVGASPGPVCLQLSQQHTCQAALGGSSHFNTSSEASSNRSRSSSINNGSARWQQHQEQQRRAAAAQAQLRRRRGYTWLSDAGSTVSANHSCCTASGSRLRLSDVLQNVTDVAALRISAHGHEGFVLQGGMEYLRAVHKPNVIYVEFWPAAMRAAGDHRPVSLLQDLYELGYTDIAHAGRVCDGRWQNATQTLHLQGSFSPSTRMALQQPTWCKLRPEQFELLATAADISAPENVMFLLGQTRSPAHPASSSSGGGSSSSGSLSSSSSSNSSSRRTRQGAAPSVPGSSAGSSGAAGDRGVVSQQQAAGTRDSATAVSIERSATPAPNPAGTSSPQQSQQPL